MTSFVHVDHPTEHPGVVRAERAFEALSEAVGGLRGMPSAAPLLLAAMVSALLVVADQVIGTWTEGHLLAAWIALWTVAFAALALLLAPARRRVLPLRAALARRAASRRAAKQDEVLWEIARTDPWVKADLGHALSASDHDGRPDRA